MRFVSYQSARECLDTVGDFLETREVENNLILGLLMRMSGEDPSVGDEEKPLIAAVLRVGSRFVVSIPTWPIQPLTAST